MVLAPGWVLLALRVAIPVPFLVTPPEPLITPEAVSPAGLAMVRVPEPRLIAPLRETVLTVWLLLLRVTVPLPARTTPEPPRTLAALVEVGTLAVRVPVPLLVVFARIQVNGVEPLRAPVRLPLFQVMGWSWVTVIVLLAEFIVPLPEFTVMDLPIVQAAVVLNCIVPPLKVRKAAEFAPDPNRFGAAKLALPWLKMNFVTLPLALLKLHEVVPALVIVPA